MEKEDQWSGEMGAESIKSAKVWEKERVSKSPWQWKANSPYTLATTIDTANFPKSCGRALPTMCQWQCGPQTRHRGAFPNKIHCQSLAHS